MTLLLITRAVIGFAIVFMTCLAAELVVMRMRARFFRAGRRRGRGQEATNLQLPGAVIEIFTIRRNPISEVYDRVDDFEAELEQLPIMPRAPKVYSGGGFRSRSRTDNDPSHSADGRVKPRRRGARYAHFVSVAAGTVGVLVFLISLHRMSMTADGDAQAHTGTHTLNISTASNAGNA